VSGAATGESAPLRVLPGGWVAGARHVPSPNSDARPAGSSVTLLVLHNISLPPGRYGGGYIERLFTNRLAAGEHPFLDRLLDTRVSAHFVVARDGALTQFVSCDARAWHAGASVFRGRPRCNDYSIGVELEGSDFEAYTEAQYRCLDALLPALAAVYPLDAVAGHSAIAADRKTDPGPCFDWARLSWPPAGCR
jgi:AmpD protein